MPSCTPSSQPGSNAPQSEASDQLVEGFEQAFTPVYRELIRLCGGDRARAEELQQDTFERAARHLERYPDRQVTTGWFITVARSAFIDQIRRDRRDSRLKEKLFALARQDAAEPDWDRLSSETALAMLAHLTDEQRVALVLFHLHGLSIAEVGVELDRSVRAVESLLVRARRRLRTLVEDNDGT